MHIPPEVIQAQKIREAGDFEQALERLEKHEKSLNSNKKIELQFCLNEQTQCLWRMGKFSEAEKKATTVLELITNFPNVKGEADANNNMGTISLYLGRLNEAEKFYTISLKLREQLGDEIEIASSFNNLGIVYSRRAEYTNAEQFLEKSIKLKEKRSDSDWSRALTYNNLAELYWRQNRLQKAEQIIVKSIKLLKPLENYQTLSDAYYHYLRILLGQDKFVESVAIVKKLLELSRTSQLNEVVAKASLAAGTLELARSNLSIALDHAQKAVSIAAEIPRFDIAMDALYLVAKSLLQLFVLNRKKAHKAHLEAVLLQIKDISTRENLHDIYSEVLLMQGFLLHAKGAFTQALNQFKAAEEEATKFDLSNTIRRAKGEIELLENQLSIYEQMRKVAPQVFAQVQLQKMNTFLKDAGR